MAAGDGTTLALGVREVRKDFPGTTALDGVSLELARGEIHALVGGNGCGKSTLVKIVAGIERADAGTAVIAGEEHDLTGFTPAQARRAGIHVVHQQSTTFPDMTIAENMAIGRGYETGLLGRIRWRAVRRRVAAALARFDIDAHPDTLLGDLSPATQTMVSIARALQDQEGEHHGVLILDEPTASLPPDEVETLLAALRRYAAAGQAILFITHRLDEVLAVCDTITVLRDGRLVASVDRTAITHDELVEMIVGQAVTRVLAREHDAPAGAEILRVDGARGGSLRDASLSLRRGEIVGIAGLAGSGRSTLLRILFGAQPLEGGTVRLDGAEVAFEEPADGIVAGVAYVPEDRGGDALFPELTVVENLSGGFLGDFTRAGRLQHRREREANEDAMRRFLVRAASGQVAISTLSGGNQQKVVLARWLRRKPKLLLLDEPTQGVDVGARAELWTLIRAAAADGAAALVVSSDFEELVGFCDRLVLVREGRTIGELGASELSVDHVNRCLHREGAAT
jgi:ribose transport system ATP-binding protein